MQSSLEFDIRDAFEAMDNDKVGRLSMGDFHILMLGLGYGRISLSDLQNHVATLQGHVREVNIDTALAVCAKVRILLLPFFDRFFNDLVLTWSTMPMPSSLQYSRFISQEIQVCFSLLDKEQKGYINADDVRLLACDVGESISETQAEAIVAQTVLSLPEEERTKKVLTSSDFCRLFLRSSPQMDHS